MLCYRIRVISWQMNYINIDFKNFISLIKLHLSNYPLKQLVRRMHISHMAFQSNELKNDTLPKWHIHTSDNGVERPKKKTPPKIKTQTNPQTNPSGLNQLLSQFHNPLRCLQLNFL